MSMIPLKYVARINAGQSPPSSDVSPLVDGLAFLQGNAEFGPTHPTARHQCDMAPKTGRPGDILLSVRAPVGALNVADRPYGIGRGLCAITPVECHGRFLWWWMHAQRNVLDSISVGTTYRSISAEDVAGLRFPRCSLDEQRRIADFLDVETSRIDTLANLRTRQRDVVKARKRAHTEKILTECRSGEWTRVKYLLRARPRYGVLVPAFVDDGVPFVRVNDLLDLPGRASRLARIPKALSDQYARTIIRPRDVLISVVGTLGRAALAPDDLVGANIARAVCSIRLRPDVDPHLFVAWADTSDFERQALLATGSDSAQPTLGMEDLSNFTARWPTDPRDQKSLVDQVEDSQRAHGELIRRTEKQLALLAERRQALITAAVTGQLDVTTARPAHDRGL